MPYNAGSHLASTNDTENIKPGWNGQGVIWLPYGQGMGGADEAGLDLSTLRSRSRKGCLILLLELGSCVWESSVLILAGITVPFTGLICSGLVSDEACLASSARHGQPWAPPARTESQSLEKQHTKMSGNKVVQSRFSDSSRHSLQSKFFLWHLVWRRAL